MTKPETDQNNSLNMEYKIIIIIVLTVFSLFYLHNAKAQFSKTASCENIEFDKKVDQYISYNAPVIDVKEAYKNKNSYIFLDAREISEYNTSHIKDALHIGYDNFNKSKLDLIPKNQPIIVYCSIGYRSEKIAVKLRKAGFQKVYNLYGSIFEWVNQGHPVYFQNKEVKKVHTYNKKWSKWLMNKTYQPVY
jgi:rhodanese-related sulfurtransferase